MIRWEGSCSLCVPATFPTPISHSQLDCHPSSLMDKNQKEWDTFMGWGSDNVKKVQWTNKWCFWHSCLWQKTSQTCAALSASSREVFDHRLEGGGGFEAHEGLCSFPWMCFCELSVSSAAELCQPVAGVEHSSPAVLGGWVPRTKIMFLCHRGRVLPVWCKYLWNSELLLPALPWGKLSQTAVWSWVGCWQIGLLQHYPRC